MIDYRYIVKIGKPRTLYERGSCWDEWVMGMRSLLLLSRLFSTPISNSLKWLHIRPESLRASRTLYGCLALPKQPVHVFTTFDARSLYETPMYTKWEKAS